MNRLCREKSAYLRHAATQPIDWYPWGEEAFQRAAAEDKPVFLSSGAVWCHWCHVMAKESFADPEVAQILGQHFISVKLDRDERPDIDRRYQQAAAVSGAGGGWPLTAFLTPDRDPFFVGTYFPPEDAYGRPGYKRLLQTIAHLYRTKREEIDDQGRQLMAATRGREDVAGPIGEELLDEGAGLVLSQFDSQNGGFGRSPKFSMAGALEFLMQRYAVTGNGVVGNAVRKTLDAMANGGFHDHLGGGFHRYSVDESWAVPHFEKMADDNAWLLRNYVDGYALFGDARYERIARGIIGFVREVLSDQSGGFYASQDADVTPDDEGGYFTWTEEEFAGGLDPEEHRVLSLLLLSPKGAMHHAPSKRVLLVSMSPDEVAGRLGMGTAEVDLLIEKGKAKLLARRRARVAPFVDTTLYTSVNGALIAAFLHAFRVLKEPEVRDFALKSLSRVLRDRWIGDDLFHSDGVDGLLDDHVALIAALLEAYEATGDSPLLERARTLTDRTIDRFWDEVHGGFFDTEQEVLGTRLKTMEDAPHPSANSVAIMLLVKLSTILKEERYRARAEAALKGCVVAARRAAVHGGSFFAALDAFYHLISLEFEGVVPADLLSEGLSLVMPFTAISHRAGVGRMIPCCGTTCFDPIYDVSRLRDFMKKASALSGVH